MKKGNIEMKERKIGIPLPGTGQKVCGRMKKKEFPMETATPGKQLH
jgi:hypothetical protein